MKAKSHDLLSASWRPSKASGVIPVQVQRPENQECWCWRPGEDGCPSSSREQICPSSAFLVCLDPQWFGWCPPALVVTICFTQSTNSNANVFQKPPYRHTQNNVSPASLGIHSSSQVWHIKLTITIYKYTSYWFCFSGEHWLIHSGPVSTEQLGNIIATSAASAWWRILSLMHC